MRILLISYADSPHTARWAEGLAGRRHDVAVFSTRPPADGADWPPGVSLHTPPPMVSGRPAHLLAGPFLRRLVRRLSPDIVHAHFASGNGALCGWWLPPRSYLLSVWGSDIGRFPTRAPARRLLRRNLQRAGALTATSEFLRRETLRHTDRAVTVIPFGVDTELFTPGPEPGPAPDAGVRVGAARRLERRSGIDILLRAVALLRRHRPELSLRLDLAGAGPERPELERLAGRLGLDDCVRFAGQVARRNMPDFLRRLDAAVLPSRAESFGVAALEAAACGVPVIAARVGGLPETVLDDRTGLLLPPADPTALAYALADVHDRPERWRRMGAAGREFATSRFRWRDSLERMENLYEEFRRGAPRP